jgi:hypothetical protein
MFAKQLSDQRRIIMATAISTSITATITITCKGLLIMWRSIANRVPSGCNAMPQPGHLPGLDRRTSECMGHR